MSIKILLLAGGVALCASTAFAQTVVVTPAQPVAPPGMVTAPVSGTDVQGGTVITPVQPRGTPAEATDTPTGTNSSAGVGGNSTGTGGIGGSGNR
ncbi:MAG: hypothetical protein JO000_27900 [Alphaproteobacteria bacterium]|nr:hypothetical protein [Alphaproteobacteria bacterium]